MSDVDEFERLLNTARREGTLQSFLKAHPELAYPDHIRCYPQFALGSEYVADFVFLVQGLQGQQYVFVEIQKATKKLFTKRGQFTAQFTQAADQLLNWERWIRRNHAYMRERIPDLKNPLFHLIIGRGHALTAEQREKLQDATAGTNKVYSTYDDLLLRFRQIVLNVPPPASPRRAPARKRSRR